LGQWANATLKFNADIAARSAAMGGIEASLAKKAVCSQGKLLQSSRVNVAIGIQLALLYAAASWPALSFSHMKKISVKYFGPLRRAVGGSWTKGHPQRPMGWDDILALSQRPDVLVALRAARLRLLPSLRRRRLCAISGQG
jgi:hypothetical protein